MNGISAEEIVSELRLLLEPAEMESRADFQPLRAAVLERTASTMAAARAIPAGTVVAEISIPAWPRVDSAVGVTVALALEQTAGRGRFDRRWVSPAGSGIYLTAAFQTTAPAAELPCLSLVAGVAVSEAVGGLGAPGLLKWPNDVLIQTPGGWRKIAGILLETASAANGTVVLVGIGMNLLQDSRAAEVGGISLAETAGREIGYSEAAAAVINRLCRELGEFFNSGPAGHLQRWQAASMMSGAAVRFKHNGVERCGTVCGLEADGALVVETEAAGGGVAERIKVISGEVIIIDAASI